MKKKNLLFTAIAILGLVIMTNAQVPTYVPTSGLAAWYSFDGDANDDSGNNNNGTVNGASLTTGKLGNSNTAYLFDGTSSNISLVNPFLGGNQNTAFTFHALIYSNSTNSDQVIWSKTLFWGEIGFNISNLNEVKFGWANSITGNKYSTIYSQTNVIQQNQWYDIVVTYENSVGQIYLNGLPIVTNLQWTAQGGSSLSTSQIEASCNFAQDANSSKIGTYQSGAYFNGKIDEFGIWNRALNQQEITDLYNDCQLVLNTQPISQTISINNNVEFVVESSDLSATYQWQTDLGVGFQNLNNVGQYSGTTNDTLTVSNVTMSNNNQPLRCIVTSTITCSDTSDNALLTVLNDVGINDVFQDNLLSIFPNPTQNVINIYVNENLIGTSFKIYDNLGKELITDIFNADQNSIELNNLSPGLYFLTCETKSQKSIKIIKQ
jgi:hypothetical protein